MTDHWYDDGAWRFDPRDNVRATLQPGEYVLSAVESAELGRRYIEDTFGDGGGTDAS